MTPLAPPPAPPMVPRLVEDVVPDDRDDPEFVLNNTTVSLLLIHDLRHMLKLFLQLCAMCQSKACSLGVNCILCSIILFKVILASLDNLILLLLIVSLTIFYFQYYYSVRIFAGQEPSGVWVGWVTPDYHQYDPTFDLSKVRSVTVTVGDDKGNIHDR